MTAAEAWARMPAWKRAWLTALDIALNLHFGGVRETLSERFAHARDRGEWQGIHACNILDAIDPGHCDRAVRFPTKDKR